MQVKQFFLHIFHFSLKPLFPGPPPSRRSLQRTLSDESIYSGQREPSSSGQRNTPTDLLFSCSTMPRSPTARHAASRRASHKSLGKVFIVDHKGDGSVMHIVLCVVKSNKMGGFDLQHIVCL